MSCRLYYFLFFISFPVFSSGQSIYPGIKAGLGGSFFKNSDVKEEYTFSYSMGVFTNYTLREDKRLSLQIEVLFASKGGASYNVFSEVQPYPIANKKLTYELYYLELPIMVKASSKESYTQLYAALAEPYRVYAMTGLAPSFFLKGRSKFDIYNDSPITNANSFDIGWVSSIGIEYRITRHTLLFVEGRVNNGFRKVFDHSSVKNFTYALMSGIRF